MPLSTPLGTPRSFFQHEAAHITVVPGEYLQLHWTGHPIDSAVLRLVYAQLLGGLRGLGLCKVLTDHRQLPRISAADRDWLTTTWAPQAVREAGYRFVAIVQAQDVMNRLAITQVVHELSVPLTSRVFADDAEAAAWLRQQR